MNVWRIALAMVALAPCAAFAQSPASYPDRPIRLLVPYPPGGSTDPIARLLAEDTAPRLGQPIVVENKPGAAGSIGTEHVVRSAPDGYTVLLHTSVIATDPTFKKSLPYDVRRDLTPVTLTVTGPYLLVVNPALPVRTVAELIAYARAHPGELHYGSGGQGSSGHLIGEMFKLAAGVDIVHVPYRGGGPSIVGLMGNQVQLLFDTIIGSKAHADSGRLRAIAVTGSTRSPAMPAVPTVAESGLEDFSVVYWLGIFVRSGTPPPIVDTLYRTFRASLEGPAVKAKLAEQGQSVQALPPDQFARVLDDDIRRWKAVIESAKIELP